MSDPMAHGPLGPDPTVDLEPPRVVLAIGAHPDDVEFGCGGTLAKWAAAGAQVHYLVCTDGSKGAWDPGQDLDQLIALRREEQRAASRVIGGEGRVAFLGRPDGELDSGMELRGAVAGHIRRVRPEVVLGHDPWKRYRLHPDHRHAGFLTTDGIVAARDPHFFPEQGLAPHRPSVLLLWEADQPDHVEDISGYQDRKVAALLAHRSQFESTMGFSGPPDQAAVDAFAGRLRDRQAAAGAPVGLAAAEAFKMISDL